jgi:hypothetical protein
MAKDFMENIEDSLNNDGLSLDAIMAEEAAATEAAPAKVKKAKAPKPAGEAKVKAPKLPEGPNPWGIHNDSGVIITASYLRKYMQCSTRGETYSLNRAANTAYFMSEEYLRPLAGRSAGEVGRIIAADDRWFDETHPRPVKTPKVKKEKVAKTTADVAAATADETVIVDHA